MRRWQSCLVALFLGCFFTFTPFSSTFTAGIIGVQSLCAQQDPVGACTDAWEDLVEAADKHCAEGLIGFCQVACDAETGALHQSLCACVVPPEGEGEGGGNE